MKINKKKIKIFLEKVVRHYYLILGYKVIAKYCKLPLQNDMRLRCTLIIHDLANDKKYGDIITLDVSSLLCNLVHIDREIYKAVTKKIPEAGIRDLKIVEFGKIRMAITRFKTAIIENKYLIKVKFFINKIKDLLSKKVKEDE